MRRVRPLILLAPLMLLAGCGRAGGGAGGGSPAALLAGLPPAYQHADIDNGRTMFTLCRSCHTAVQGGADVVGPNLYGVFGRKAGSKPGFDYSSALKATGWTWDAGRLDTWLTDPRAAVPGTKMTFEGIADNDNRRDLIAYLKVVTSGGPP